MMIFSKKTISNALIRHGPYACSPCNTPLLKQKPVEARSKLTEQHSEKPLKYWNYIVWQDKTKTELFGRHNTHHVWSKGTAYHPENTKSAVKLV